ncbi:hypothetical protein [Kutzneria sp. NPDC052558]
MGDVLTSSGNVWPNAEKFLVTGASMRAVERSMAQIIHTYTLTTTAGDQ